MSHPAPTSMRAVLTAEAIGTFLLVFFGCGAVASGVLMGEVVGIGQMAIIWATAIALAIYAVSAISGAHLNPSVTLAFVVHRKLPLRSAGWYLVGQMVGAIAAAALLWAIFHNIVAAFEFEHGLVRGEPGSQKAAMILACYFPNPASLGTDAKAFAQFSHGQAILAEIVGTALLVFAIFALIDHANRNRPIPSVGAVFIGLTVGLVMCTIAPLTMAALNPARDLGPRLIAFLAGYGPIAFPGPRGGFFTVYILAPLVGGVIGGFLYDRMLHRPHRNVPDVDDAE